MTYKVTENNAGGITLYCVDVNGNEFAHNGYESIPGQLFEDLSNLLCGQDVSGWEGNDLQSEEICKIYRTKIEYGEFGRQEVIDDEDMYDDDGNLIAIDIEDYYDNKDTTSLVLYGDQSTMTINRSHAVNNFSNEMRHIGNIIDARDYCPKIVIE